MASSSPRIYTSALPPVALTHTSLFTRLFGPRTSSGLDIGGFAPTAPAHIDAVTGTTLSRAQTRDFALTFAHGLRNHPTTAPYSKRGQTVMFFAPNALASPVLLFGCIAAGLRCTLANSAYTPRELAHQYSDSGAALIITTPDGLAVVRSMFADVNIDEQEGLARVVVFEPQDLRWAGGRASPARCRTGTVMFEELLGMGKLDSEERFDGRDAHETVYLCYSSGTTGKAKGVETSHHNLTVVIDIMAHIYPALPAERNRALGILPFYHIYGKSFHNPY
ncbi:hypothetical protein C8F01DRAFT_1253407 [Mycena amicta]|nr:hypothetical protein C8F01DRAFT_1253407 [Mycena amicta]